MGISHFHFCSFFLLISDISLNSAHYKVWFPSGVNSSLERGLNRDIVLNPNGNNLESLTWKYELGSTLISARFNYNFFYISDQINAELILT